MTVYGIVITMLLAFPWVLFAVPFAGAAWSALARNRSGSGSESMPQGSKIARRD